MELTGYEYICSAGETWDSVALAIYDDEQYAADLLCANPEYCDRIVFDGGERLLLVEIEMPEDDTDNLDALPVTPPWKE